jgi:hypothetical protein
MCKLPLHSYKGNEMVDSELLELVDTLPEDFATVLREVLSRLPVAVVAPVVVPTAEVVV